MKGGRKFHGQNITKHTEFSHRLQIYENNWKYIGPFGNFTINTINTIKDGNITQK
jgi:hypothetical protein